MVSGPIRRSKTFFMGGYQGFYENIPFPVTRTVPTDGAAARRLLADDDRQRHADPHLRPGDDALQRANFSSCTRQPFPGNVIPENRWNPIARALLPYIPAAERHAEQPRRARATSSARRTSAAIATTRT